jgi:hypothetical protein
VKPSTDEVASIVIGVHDQSTQPARPSAPNQDANPIGASSSIKVVGLTVPPAPNQTTDVQVTPPTSAPRTPLNSKKCAHNVQCQVKKMTFVPKVEELSEIPPFHGLRYRLN